MRNNVLILFLLVAVGLFTTNRSNAQAVILKTDSISLSCASQDTFLVPVRVENFSGVGAVQFTLTWNAANLDYAYTTPLTPPFSAGNGATIGFDTSAANLNAGRLTFTWTRFGGLSVPGDTMMFALAFRRIGGGPSPVAFSDMPVVVEVTDADGNEIPHTVENGGVFPVDLQAPTISCPANVTVQGSGATPVNGIAPTAADNCGTPGIGWSASGATTANQPGDSDASGAFFNVGLSTVTYLATDPGNNTASCSFMVTVEFVASSDSLTLIAGTTTANCGQLLSVPITTANFDSLGSLQFSLGWNPLVLSYSSVSNFNPALNLTPNEFGTSQTSNGFLAFAWTTSSLAGTSLPDGAVLFTLNFNVLGSAGNTALTFGDTPTPREAYSNATLPAAEVGAVWVNGQITVVDNLPPVLICPIDVAVDADPGQVTALVNGLEPQLSDCSGTPALTFVRSGTTPGSGTGPANGIYNAGTTIVTYTATDAGGNTATCSFTVIVDAGTPVTLILDSVSTSCQSSGQQIAVDLTVNDFIDLIGLQFQVTWNNTILSFDSVGNIYPGLNLTPGNFLGYASTPNGLLQFLGGNAVSGWPNIPDGGTFFTIYFTILDDSGATDLTFTPPFDAVNTAFNPVAVSTQNGYFSGGADLTPPVITDCPTNVVVAAPGNACDASVMLSLPTATDACGTIDTIYSNHPDTLYPVGVTTVIFTVADVAGNSATCSLAVTVNDTIAPQITNCPPDTVVAASSNGCIQQVSWAEPLAIDNCAFDTLTASATPGSFFFVGPATTVTYTATDASGNTATCSFSVTVVDTVAPQLQCPPNLTANADSATCSALVDFITPVGIDQCDTSLVVTGTANSGSTFPVGVTTVTFTATDDSGNTGTCSFTVSVFDATAPTISCPPNQQVSVSTLSCAADASWQDPVASDDCDDSIVVTPDVASGSSFPVGTSTVTYTATDDSGNSSTCTFTVNVSENVLPVLSNCPTFIVVNLQGGACEATATWNLPVANDNCGIDSLSTTAAPGSIFPAGTTTVTYTATDLSGNAVTCSFSVVVQDPVAPQFQSCPQDTTFIGTGACGVVYNWADPIATDNCTAPDELVYTFSDTSRTFYNGVYNVVIQVADASQNTDTCSFTVTVQGSSTLGFDPATIPTNFVQTGCEAIVCWERPVPTGFCGTPVVTINLPGVDPNDPNPCVTFPAGIDTVIYTVVDTTGVPVSVSFTVSITEAIPPVMICPAGPIVVTGSGAVVSDPNSFISDITAGPNCSGASLEFGLPAATDNCGDPAVTQTGGPLSGAFFTPGVDTLRFQAEDAAGNITLCNVPISILGLEPLSLDASPNPGCLGEVVNINALAIPGATYTWTGPQGPFPTGPVMTITNLNAGTAGTYTVSATFSGCTTPPATIAVELVTPPNAADDIVLLEPGQLDTFSVLLNDQFAPPSDFAISTVGNAIPGLTLIDTLAGIFTFQAGSESQNYTFIYQLCSESCDVCDMANVTISVRGVDEGCPELPNVITPNGDNLNDYLVIECLNSGLYPDNSIVIYNQWGDKIYEAAPYDNSPLNAWRGTLNGDSGHDLPDGVYFYVFKTAPNEAPKKGFIEIFR